MGDKASEQYIWVFPKGSIPKLAYCSIFYGDEKSYKKFIKGSKGLSMKDIMKKTVKFKK